MANSFEDEYKDRGVIFVTVVIDDSPDAGTTVDWTDAQYWAYSMDFDGDGIIDKQRHVILADTDGGLWKRYVDQCADLTGINFLLCQASCNVTPQYQIFDQGGMTVDDTCARQGTGVQCAACGYDEAHVRSVLDSLLPPKWCGEATP